MAIGLNVAQIIDRAKGRGINLSNEEADAILGQSYDPGQYGADPSSVDSLLSARSQQDSNDPVNIIDPVRQSVLEIMKPREEAGKKYNQFMEDNPFEFDEALARASAEERFDPFYEAELRDFEEGINRQRGRTVQDEERLRKELTTQTENYVGRAKRELDDALQSSREGFAGAGLFFSGQRLKREGRTELESGEQVGDFVRGQDIRREESGLRQTRTFEDIGSKERTGRRLHGAARETDILTDISGQRGEELKRREFEARQFAGGPISSDQFTGNLLTSL